MNPLENISELINDYIQLYGTRTSTLDEAVTILNEKYFEVYVKYVEG